MFAAPASSVHVALTRFAFGLAAAVTAAPSAFSQQCPITFVGGDLTGGSAIGGVYPGLSADGRRVAYLQSNGIYAALLYDRWSGGRLQIDTYADGSPMNGAVSVIALSADGRRATFLSAASLAGSHGEQVFIKHIFDGALRLVTVKTDGTPMTPTGTNLGMGAMSIDCTGRQVVFTSDSKELVAGKTSFWRDVFVRDVDAGTTTRLLALGGAEPDKPALFEPALSANGRFVAFASRATNLVAGDTNSSDDVFVHDLELGVTERVSTSSSGAQANGHSMDAAISADGRYVVFRSIAGNLVSGDTNGFSDVFVHDRATGETVRANVGPGGVQADGLALGIPRLTADGRHVLFHSIATNLLAQPVPVNGRLYLRDLDQLVTSAVAYPVSMSENDVCSLSADGQVVAFASTLPFGPLDTNGFFDVYLRACSPAAPTSYCTASVSSTGCTATMEAAGVPSASAGTGFVLSTQGSPGARVGVLAYSTSAGGLAPFGGGFMCVTPPLKRTGALVSNGTAGQCNGSFARDFNAWISGGSDPALIAGAVVWAQFFARDPGAGPTNTSNAMTFAIGP